jgi:hypothetical protein
VAKSESSSEKGSKRELRLAIKKAHVIITVLVLASAAGGYFGYTKYDELQKENKRLSNPQEAAKSESERIKKEIASLIEVPTDEEPTIATVVDPSKLGGQAFFTKAQKDDRVIIYAKAKRAILYRPSTKKIIEVAPLNIGENSQPTQPTTQPATATESAPLQ